MLNYQLLGTERALVCGVCCLCGVNILTKAGSGCKHITGAELGGNGARWRVHSCLVLQGGCPPLGQQDGAVTFEFLSVTSTFHTTLGNNIQNVFQLPCMDTRCSDWSLSIAPEPTKNLAHLTHCRFSSKTPLARVPGVSCRLPEQFYAYKNTNIESSSNYLHKW